ncbi:hypothetical protein [Clostridium sp.]|uniref:hypothetical protein n=1 Tax=Clostridium sp. TaxID=1506 RepID=UPI002FCB84DF
MLKKLSLTLISLVFLTSLLIGCTGSEYKEQKINEVAIIKYNEITKITFSDGRGGINKPFTIDDKQKISEFLGLLDKYVIKKEKKHEDFVGWIHMANFYNGEKKLMRITFTNPLQIDETYYDIVKGELSTKDIDNFIKSVNPTWKTPQ